MFANGKFRRLGALTILALIAIGAGPAQAAELVMFTRAGCPWCMRFEREVAPIYARTQEGRAAPLRRLELKAGGFDEAGLTEPVFATPTFVLIDQGREIGRITGYSGDDAFWGLLGKMLAGGGEPVQRTGAALVMTESQ
jgi:hypothetical protein